jgi:2-(3-amino-3-carboxypropyl)histidine synthase
MFWFLRVSMKTLKELEKIYEFDFERVINKIKKQKAKRVLLQFPDGLKQYATEVVDYLEEKTGAEFLIWFGDCFGACDTPTGIENLGIDLVVQFGHNDMMPSF